VKRVAKCDWCLSFLPDGQRENGKRMKKFDSYLEDKTIYRFCPNGKCKKKFLENKNGQQRINEIALRPLPR
jgi:hypothetical protein